MAINPKLMMKLMQGGEPTAEECKEVMGLFGIQAEMEPLASDPGQQLAGRLEGEILDGLQQGKRFYALKVERKGSPMFAFVVMPGGDPQKSVPQAK